MIFPDLDDVALLDAAQGAELHDASYFRLAGHEALALDPQTRLLLEASAEVS